MQHGTENIIKFTKDISGINLDESKRSLIYNRLNRRLKELDIDLDEYCDICQNNDKEKQHFLDLITTNHTSFMRESAHFIDVNDRIIPALITKNTNRLRVWSAACSSGQEPYSLLIRILEKYPDCKHWDIKVLATDISKEILHKAKNAIYDEDELKGVSNIQQNLGFDTIPNRDGKKCVQIKKHIQNVFQK